MRILSQVWSYGESPSLPLCFFSEMEITFLDKLTLSEAYQLMMGLPQRQAGRAMKSEQHRPLNHTGPVGLVCVWFILTAVV